MKYYKCGRKPVQNNLDMLPIEPKGTPNRKWVCTECATPEQINSIPKDVRGICNAINPEFIKRGD